MKIHHIGLIVKDLDSAIRKYQDIFNVQVSDSILMEKYKVRIALIEFDNIQLEFIQPLSNEGEYHDFLLEQGGLHHLAIEVKDVHATIEELSKKDIKMKDPTPKLGANNSLIAFSDKNSFQGVAFEFKQFL